MRPGTQSTWSNERGFSLVELMVVCLIIGIVASIAIMNFATPNKQFKRQNVARELKVAFERARFDSVKRHAADPFGPATVVVNSGSYTLTTDLNQDGTFQSSESVVTNIASDITISGYSSLNLPVTVTFDRRGEVTATDASNSVVTPQFRVCNGTCSQSSSASDSNIVLVTPTGTVNMLMGDASIPTFANANVTSIGTSSGISNKVSLP